MCKYSSAVNSGGLVSKNQSLHERIMLPQLQCLPNYVASDPSNSETIIILTSQATLFLLAGSVTMPLPACFDLVLRSLQFILYRSITLIDCNRL